jgi:hypothetical protein
MAVCCAAILTALKSGKRITLAVKAVTVVVLTCLVMFDALNHHRELVGHQDIQFI